MKNWEKHRQDALFGPLLVISASLNLVMGIVFIVSDFIVTAFPEATTKSLGVLVSIVPSSKQSSTAKELKRDIVVKVFPLRGGKTAVAPVSGRIIVDSVDASDSGESKESVDGISNCEVASETRMIPPPILFSSPVLIAWFLFLK